jgi:hypothetical protein
VPQTPDAEAVFRCVRERADAEYASAEAQNDPAGMAIWARVKSVFTGQYAGEEIARDAGENDRRSRPTGTR